MDNSDGKTERRGALKIAVWAGGATFCGALAAPGVVFITAPSRLGGAGKEHWVRTVKLDTLHEGEPKKVTLVADRRDAWTTAKDEPLGSVWLVRRGAQVAAFSTVCPHLGCSINADAGGAFRCPCHDSGFAVDGTCLSGPSPRGMDPLHVRIDEEFVVVDFRKFRQGSPDRIEIA